MKAEIVAADERESGLRMILNLGHTLGHAIEAATGYQQLLHGEAVAWGMLAAAAIARRRGLVTDTVHDRIERVVKIYGPLKSFRADPAQLVALTAKDKKNRNGARSFVLPLGIGDAVVVQDVTVEELTYTAERMMTMVAKEGADVAMETTPIHPGARVADEADEAEAAANVRAMFNSIAPTYDRLNHPAQLWS